MRVLSTAKVQCGIKYGQRCYCNYNAEPQALYVAMKFNFLMEDIIMNRDKNWDIHTAKVHSKTEREWGN